MDFIRKIFGGPRRLETDMGDGTHADRVIAHPPFNLLAGSTARRFRVDNGQTGFFERRMFRINHEFTDLADTPMVFKFVCPVNFILHYQSLEVDQGGIVIRTYRASQGTEGGTFSGTIPIYSNNFMDEEPEYTFQTAVTTGGTFTPTVAGSQVETIRVRTAGATAQQVSVGQGVSGERGIPAGTYYIVAARMSGVSGDCKGVYSLIVEERP